MQIQDCSKGLRVRHRETGKSATIKEVFLDRNELEIIFDNAMTSKMHPRLVELLAEDNPVAPSQPAGPQRACPNCAAKMPAEATICPKCGFQYGVKPVKKSSGLLVLIIALIIAAGAAVAVWKFVLSR